MSQNKINVGEETDPGLTAAALAAFGPRPKLLAVASSAVPSRSPSSGAATAPVLEESAAPLFSPEEAKEFRARWDAIQVGFVDDPRHAVGQANALVDATLTRLAAMFASQTTKLEAQWVQNGSVSTEELRLVLRQYRFFFGSLLTA